jgi:hypothetical protein
MALLEVHRACRLHLEVEPALARAHALVGDPPELAGGCATILQSLSL